jgi:lysophospholipase L1-like esterase
MNSIRPGLAGIALACLGAATLAATPAPSAGWIGTWGFAAGPLPPGAAPPPFGPPPSFTALPLGPITPAPSRPAVPSPAVENPGNVPIIATPADLANITVRQLVRVSVGGQRLRLRISNEAGAETLTLGAVHIGEAGPDGSVIAGTDRVVTFDGHPDVTAPASSPVLSDPIELPTKPLDRLYISVYAPGAIPSDRARSLYHYVAGIGGDQTSAAQLPNARLMRVRPFVTLVETLPSAPADVIVTIGDSITEGAQATENAFRSWPDRLAERLAGSNWGVVNVGIGGNRLLRYGTGPTALARLDRDVLSVPGVKVLILMEGINDIGRGFTPPGTIAGPREPVTLDALIAADKQIIARAHEHGIRVIGATLTPYQGALYASAEGEAVREGLNQWIKNSGAFDGVIDFAPVLASAANPLSFDPRYNERDHLHPNDAGYRAMGDSIDLKLITGTDTRRAR